VVLSTKNLNKTKTTATLEEGIKNHFREKKCGGHFLPIE
jgi:hypothetical protein